MNGAEKARNVYGRNLIAREVDGEKAIYRYNGHGDVITIMGTDGTAISSYEYDEFGNETVSTGTFDNPYRYAGYEYLDEVELYDLNARYYDPSIARFLTEDPYYNLGNRVMGVYEINVPNVYSIMQDNSSDHGPNNSHYSGGYNERKTDSYQLRLIVDYNLDLDCFVSEAVRLNTDNMIYGDNPVKINERENPYNPNNSVTFAYSPNINAVLQSGNLYAYCINNPVILTDHTGLWTFGISFGTNANLFFGISLSIGFYIDDDFNFDIQYSYSIPGVDDTMSVGFLDAGAGISVQITDAEHVDDLLGASTSMGASVGSAVSLGVDLISFDDVVSDSSSDIDGFQVTAGLGAGVDIHVNKTKTKSLLN